MRPPRDCHAGLFHVYTHCVWPARAYFRDDDDRWVFLRRLAITTAKFGWTSIAYCLLDTHCHAIVGVGDGVLPRAMQALNWNYAMYFNQRHASRGHVQFARYGSRRIVDDEDLIGVFRYLALNPVDAGLCARPQDWQWSSYAGTVGLAELPSFVDASHIYAAYAPLPRETAIARLRAHVEDL